MLSNNFRTASNNLIMTDNSIIKSQPWDITLFTKYNDDRKAIEFSSHFILQNRVKVKTDMWTPTWGLSPTNKKYSGSTIYIASSSCGLFYEWNIVLKNEYALKHSVTKHFFFVSCKEDDFSSVIVHYYYYYYYYRQQENTWRETLQAFL